MEERRIAFFDIDNTLWDFYLNIPESTGRAIRTLRENGHLAFINSGRSRGYIRSEELFALGFDGIVSSCGQMIECTPECLLIGAQMPDDIKLRRRDISDITKVLDWSRVAFSYEMSAEEVARCVRTVRAHKMRPILEGKEYLYFDDHEFGGDRYGEFIRATMGDALLGIDENWGKWEVSKFSCAMDDPEQIMPCYRELDDLVDFLIHNDQIAEMVPHGFSKGTGIEKVCQMTGIPIRNTIAFGDSVNDLEMLKTAGTGVAMGNGTDVCKEAADYVTTDIHDDGILNACAHLGLI